MLGSDLGGFCADNTADRCRKICTEGSGIGIRGEGVHCAMQEMVHAVEEQLAFLKLSKQVGAGFLRCVTCAVQEMVYAAAEEQQKAFLEHLAQVEAENPEQGAALEW